MPGPGRRVANLFLLAALVGCVPSVAAPSSFELPNATPTSTPLPARSPAESGIASAAAIPSATLQPTPPATPDPSTLELEATSCDGGVVLGWSASVDPTFHHYSALRSPDREIAPDYPPIAPAVDWGDTYATDRFVSSAVDASIIPSETRWYYRVMAYDAEGAVVGASPVRTARLLEVDDLGDIEAATENGVTRLEWSAYGGFSGCFSSYRVLFGTGASPTTVLAVISDQGATTFQTDALHPGTTYVLRVQAVRATTLGSFVAGQTGVATYTVP
jgi:hypothetical protein